ncbi:unnamed protein product, partial [marine sediment metagenome]
DNNGVSKTLINNLKSIHLRRHHTTQKGGNIFYYEIPGLKKYSVDCSFKKQETNIYKPKGLNT